MKTLLAVKTCPRPDGVSYLQRTLESLAKAGALENNDRVVISDGYESLAIRDWAITMGPGPSGPAMALGRVLQQARQYDQILLFEDDLVACKNAIPWMLKVGVPDDLFLVSFFDVDRCKTGTEPGLYRFPNRVFSSTLCVLLPKRSVEFLLSRDQFHRHESADSLLSSEMGLSPWPYYGLHYPSLVEHVGAVSAKDPLAKLVKGRVATHFVGVDFDALSLPHFTVGAEARAHDPARIPDIISQLKAIWERQPSLPLPLLLANVTASADLFTLSDADLIRKLQSYYGEVPGE